MFSARSDFDLTPNSLALKLDRLAKQGRRIVDLTVSNPTAVALEYPADEILKALGAPEVMSYRPDPLGLESARRAVQRFYLGRKVEVETGDIVLTASTSEAYGYLFKLLADPGDRVLVPTPSYPLFRFLAALESIEIIAYPLHYADDWFCDLAELDRLAAKFRPRAILTVHPNNPTGSYMREHELDFIREICRRENAALVCDEVFADFRLQETEPADAAADDSVLTFVLNGLSKMLLLPQLKLGWIVLRGPDSTRSSARERLELIADTFLSVNSISQLALEPLMGLRQTIQKSVNRRLHGNLETLNDRLAGHSTQILRVGGGWSAVLRFPSHRSDEEWCIRLLEEHGVLVHPGSFFDFASPGYCVISLLAEPESFSRGVELLLRSLDESE